MTKHNLSLWGLALAFGVVACNEGTNTTAATSTSDQTGNTVTNPTGNISGDTTSILGNNGTALNAQDSSFAMKAAAGGMMEVEAGNASQQKAQNSRVKAYGAMMVKDHSAANQELMTILSGRGMQAPSALPQEHQNHLAALNKTNGAAFDKQYMSMMVSDHEKTIADFERQANAGTDAALKAFAAKNLPILRMHRDSAVAINNAIK
jgi:putative membrane protein